MKSTGNRYRFVSRKPFFKISTAKPEDDIDQMKESSNQQSLEQDIENAETTELGDIAVALQEIQQAPLPIKHSTNGTTAKLRETTEFSDIVAVLQEIQQAPLLKNTRTNPVKTATQRIRVPTKSRATSTRSTTPLPLLSTTKKFAGLNRRPQAFEKINPAISGAFQPLLQDYDYYDERYSSVLGQIPEHSKVLLHSNGIIECLDQGNFPHPISCKKFISCAKMENGNVLGWEYTCPKNLSFDPIGGICNWSAGLGCNE